VFLPLQLVVHASAKLIVDDGQIQRPLSPCAMRLGRTGRMISAGERAGVIASVRLDCGPPHTKGASALLYINTCGAAPERARARDKTLRD
jgi:hypothetical protein